MRILATEQYSSWWRGVPAKDIGRATGARVRVSLAPPLISQDIAAMAELVDAYVWGAYDLVMRVRFSLAAPFKKHRFDTVKTAVQTFFCAFCGLLGPFYLKFASFIQVSAKNATAAQDFLLNWHFYKKTIGCYKKTIAL